MSAGSPSGLQKDDKLCVSLLPQPTVPLTLSRLILWKPSNVVSGEGAIARLPPPFSQCLEGFSELGRHKSSHFHVSEGHRQISGPMYPYSWDPDLPFIPKSAYHKPQPHKDSVPGGAAHLPTSALNVKSEGTTMHKYRFFGKNSFRVCPRALLITGTTSFLSLGHPAEHMPLWSSGFLELQ